MLATLAPQNGAAQQVDSARVGVAPQQSSVLQAAADTVPRPPMSPRRAFLTSLILPGYAQTVFGRDRAAMLFAVVEIGAVGMARKAAHSLAQAKALSRDSVVETYRIDPVTGRAVLDAAGKPVPATFAPSRFTPERVRARRTHYEDWIAAILFNHLISGADAYVAANLWDFRTNVNVTASPRSTAIVATVRFR